MLSVYISVLIALHMYQCIMVPTYRIKAETVFKRCIGGLCDLINLFATKLLHVVTLLAMLNSLIPFYFNQYEEIGYYCWISQPASGSAHVRGFIMRLALRYCQCVLVCVLNVWMYVTLYNYISKLDFEIKANEPLRQGNANKSNRAKDTIRKFIFYPSKCTVSAV